MGKIKRYYNAAQNGSIKNHEIAWAAQVNSHSMRTSSGFWGTKVIEEYGMIRVW